MTSFIFSTISTLSEWYPHWHVRLSLVTFGIEASVVEPCMSMAPWLSQWSLTNAVMHFFSMSGYAWTLQPKPSSKNQLNQSLNNLSLEVPLINLTLCVTILTSYINPATSKVLQSQPESFELFLAFFLFDRWRHTPTASTHHSCGSTQLFFFFQISATLIPHQLPKHRHGDLACHVCVLAARSSRDCRSSKDWDLQLGELFRPTYQHILCERKHLPDIQWPGCSSDQWCEREHPCFDSQPEIL
jgi:hypothetical protein